MLNIIPLQLEIAEVRFAYAMTQGDNFLTCSWFLDGSRFMVMPILAPAYFSTSRRLWQDCGSYISEIIV